MRRPISASAATVADALSAAGSAKQRQSKRMRSLPLASDRRCILSLVRRVSVDISQRMTGDRDLVRA
jgi:hypothetical protein